MKASSTEVVVKLIETFPACASERGDSNQLPLHAAVDKSLPAEVVQQLLDAYPDGAKQLDKAGMIPLHYAVGVKQTRELWLESVHPYADGKDEYTPIEVAGALSYLITFDEQSSMEENCDFITFYKDGSHTEYWGEQKYTGSNTSELRNNFPGINDRPPLEIPAGRFVVYFHSDESGTDWGYKIHVAVRRLVETEDMVARRCSVISKLLEAYPSGASARMRGGQLPFIVALDAEEPTSILEVLFTAHPPAGREKNKAGYVALHYALERKYPTSLVYQCLSQVMPITLEGAPEASDVHDYWWTHVLSSTADQYVDAVDDLLNDYVQHIQMLADCTDRDGRKAVDIATLEYKKCILSHIYFFGRYELKSGPSEHQSATCIVRLATDHNDPLKGMVALKFMHNKDQFDRELNIRKTYDLAGEFVLGALHSHDGDADPKYRLEAERKGYKEYPYCLVLPSADRNLSSMLIHERIAGREWDTIRSICMQIAKALGHMHSKGLIHGDVKPLNIMRMGTRFLMIDLDATVSCKNGDCMGAKYSSAYLPPEMLYIDPADPTAAPLIKTYETDPDTGMPIDTERKFELLKAHVSQDMWSFGMTFFHMCAGVPFFRTNDEGWLVVE
jgi:serine/threonine protein kinase